MNRCPNCDSPVQVWPDNSDVTVNFCCANVQCPYGKGPWDTPRPLTGYEQLELDAWDQAQEERARFKA